MICIILNNGLCLFGVPCVCVKKLRDSVRLLCERSKECVCGVYLCSNCHSVLGCDQCVDGISGNNVCRDLRWMDCQSQCSSREFDHHNGSFNLCSTCNAQVPLRIAKPHIMRQSQLFFAQQFIFILNGYSSLKQSKVHLLLDNVGTTDLCQLQSPLKLTADRVVCKTFEFNTSNSSAAATNSKCT